LLYLTFYRKQ